jgi:DNA-binding NtrC family response regulator
MRGRILVVDDEASIREVFQHNLSESGFEVQTAGSGEEALAVFDGFRPDVVVTDVRMEGMNGLELLSRLRANDPDIMVLVMTAHEDMRSAVTAMKEGALDYLVKPVELDALEVLLERAIRDRATAARARRQQEGAAEEDGVQTLIGRAPAMIGIYKLIGVLAQNRATVLVRGETGTGKERVARAIHVESPQAEEPFLAVNCTALSDSLLESELFGHVRGAFTGAVANRRGIFEMAGSGTVFLDEIGDTSPDFQSKLLRVLQDGEYLPVGSEQVLRTDARIIAATHRPLEQLVEEGTFREDLYFRLRVVEVVVPPLRDRPSDIPLLVDYFLHRISRQLHQPGGVIAGEAMEKLLCYHWPGNVRELENVLTRAVVLSRGGVIREDQVVLGGGVGEEPGADGAGEASSVGPEGDTLAAAEARHVQALLDRCGGNKRKTARELGITRPRLDRIIERHGLRIQRPREYQTGDPST